MKFSLTKLHGLGTPKAYLCDVMDWLNMWYSEKTASETLVKASNTLLCYNGKFSVLEWSNFINAVSIWTKFHCLVTLGEQLYSVMNLLKLDIGK